MQGEDARAAHWLSEAIITPLRSPKQSPTTPALLLQKRLMEAFNFGMRQLKLDGTNGWVAGYVIQAASRCPELPDPIGEIPELLRGLADVAAARVDFLRLRDQVPSWWLAAKEEHTNHPDHKFLAQCAAEAELDEIGRSEAFRLNSRLAPELKERVRRAAAVLRAHWDERRITENPQRADGVAACCNLLGADHALGETQEALSIAKQAVAVIPDDETLLQRAAIAGLRGGG